MQPPSSSRIAERLSCSRSSRLTVLGLVRARRRRSGSSSACSTRRSELTEVVNGAPARGAGCGREARSPGSKGDFDAVARETRSCLELAQRCEAPWVIGELAFWRRQAGLEEDLSADAAEPYAAQLQWASGSAPRTLSGCRSGVPTGRARLPTHDDEQMARRGLDELQALGGRPAQRCVARRLRERGANAAFRGGPAPRPARTPRT